MLNFNSPINNHIKYNDISVKEVSPIMKLNLRGKKREFFTTVGKHLDMILPTEANTSSSSSKLTSIWLSPDEWMIVSNEKTEKDTNNYDLEENLYNSISKTNLGAVVDVTDQFVMLELEGCSLMFVINCPYCGERDQLEFKAGGEAHIERPKQPTELSDDEYWKN